MGAHTDTYARLYTHEQRNNNFQIFNILKYFEKSKTNLIFIESSNGTKKKVFFTSDFLKKKEEFLNPYDT